MENLPANSLAWRVVLVALGTAAALATACEPHTAPAAAPRAAQCGYNPICISGDKVCTIDANGCDLCTCNMSPRPAFPQ